MHNKTGLVFLEVCTHYTIGTRQVCRRSMNKSDIWLLQNESTRGWRTWLSVTIIQHTQVIFWLAIHTEVWRNENRSILAQYNHSLQMKNGVPLASESLFKVKTFMKTAKVKGQCSIPNVWDAHASTCWLLHLWKHHLSILTVSVIQLARQLMTVVVSIHQYVVKHVPFYYLQ